MGGRTGDIIEFPPPLVTKREPVDRITSHIDRAITVAE